MSFLEANISALCYSLYAERCQLLLKSQRTSAAPNRAFRFVINELQASPEYVRLSLSALVLVFALSALPCHGGTFAQATLYQRQLQINRWRSSQIGVFRDFIRFFESLVLFDLANGPAHA